MKVEDISEQRFSYCCIREILIYNDDKVFLLELLNVNYNEHFRALKIENSAWTESSVSIQ